MAPALHLVRQGLAVGFFPRSFIQRALARGELVELELQDAPPLERRSALVRRSRAAALEPAARDLVEALRARALAMGWVAAKRSVPHAREPPLSR